MLMLIHIFDRELSIIFLYIFFINKAIDIIVRFIQTIPLFFLCMINNIVDKIFSANFKLLVENSVYFKNNIIIHIIAKITIKHKFFFINILSTDLFLFFIYVSYKSYGVLPSLSLTFLIAPLETKYLTIYN